MRFSIKAVSIPLYTACLMLGIFAFPEDLAGWIVPIGTLLIISRDKHLAKCPAGLFTVLLIVFCHHLVAICNSYFFTVEGAGLDALTIHKSALSLSLEDVEIAVGYFFFLGYITIVYEYFGSSLFLSNELSVLAFTGSILLFFRLIESIRSKWIPVVLLAFGMLPHVLIYTSITLREPWQLLFLVAMLYNILKYKRELTFKNLVLFLVSAVLLSLTHQVLVFFATVFTACALLWPPYSTKSVKVLISFTMVISMVVVTAIIFKNFSQGRTIKGAEVIGKVLEENIGNLADRLTDYRAAINKDNPRSRFDSELDLSSFDSLIRTLPVHVTDYLFSPFPWNAEKPKDLLLSLVSVLRFFLMVTILVLLLRRQSSAEEYFCIVVYFLIVCTWLLGTTNYGQASRHHVLSDWLLIFIVSSQLSHVSRNRFGSYGSIRSEGMRLSP